MAAGGRAGAVLYHVSDKLGATPGCPASRRRRFSGLPPLRFGRIRIRGSRTR
jgi:hypothetical protein